MLMLEYCISQMIPQAASDSSEQDVMDRQYEIFADYRQFYVWDHRDNRGAPTEFTDEDVLCRIKAAPFVIVVQPERELDVPVTVEVRNDPPPNPEFDEWDHVAEASLDVPSGKLEIHESTGGSVDILAVTPGSYRLRACFGGLDTLSDDGLDGDDCYRLVLWPAPFAPVEVLKQYIAAD